LGCGIPVFKKKTGENYKNREIPEKTEITEILLRELLGYVVFDGEIMRN